MADPTWPEVKALAEGDIKRARDIIDAHGADLAKTEYFRGQLAAMKTILALGDKRKDIPGFAIDV